MTDWNSELTSVGALWEHDGHPNRPYGLLTSGRISGHFADMSYVMAQPYVLAKAARELASKVTSLYGSSANLVICGQQEGSTTLASRIAEELNCGFIYTTKVGEGANKKMVLAERFEGIFPEGSLVILVEDVTTTAGTSDESLKALKQVGFLAFRNLLLTLVDRTGGKNKFGFEIISCFTPENFPSWPEGENPHTKDGKEIVPPVRPKTKAGRKAMRQVL